MTEVDEESSKISSVAGCEIVTPVTSKASVCHLIHPCVYSANVRPVATIAANSGEGARALTDSCRDD